jgi:hypothetical protein
MAYEYDNDIIQSYCVEMAYVAGSDNNVGLSCQNGICIWPTYVPMTITLAYNVKVTCIHDTDLHSSLWHQNSICSRQLKSYII